jgi:hypothetical protein
MPSQADKNKPVWDMIIYPPEQSIFPDAMSGNFPVFGRLDNAGPILYFRELGLNTSRPKKSGRK